VVIYNYKAGKTIAEIADITGEHRETVRRWMATARKRGLDGIPRRIAKGGERLLTLRQRAALVKDVHKGPRGSATRPAYGRTRTSGSTPRRGST